MLFGFTSCQKTNYKLGPFSSPTSLQLTATVVGITDTTPNGDGSGRVVFNVSAKAAAAYKVDFGNGSGPSFVSSFPDTVTYNQKVGTFKYGVTVTAYAVANAAPAVTTTDSISVFYAYHVPAAVLKTLTNDSPQGRLWMVDSAAVGNMGLGPNTSYYPDWYNAAPGDKAGLGLYQNVYVFTNNGIFVDSTYGEMFGNKGEMANDFNNGVTPPPGKFGGYGDDWTLYQGTYSTSYTFSGDNAAANETGVIINFQKPGSLGYYIGTQAFEILTMTDSTMWLRTEKPAWSMAYYVKLKAKN